MNKDGIDIELGDQVVIGLSHLNGVVAAILAKTAIDEDRPLIGGRELDALYRAKLSPAEKYSVIGVQYL